ncbi:MAG: hypothetical protein ACYC6Y_12700 [Thermoguttaceae bacterium]
MSSVSTPGGSTWTDEPPPLVRWRRWPLRDNLAVGVMGVVGLLSAGYVVYRQTGRFHLAAAAVGVLAVSAWRFFLPVTFELNAEGVHQWVWGRHRRIPWGEIHGHRIFPAGVLLLPYEEGAPMDVIHGLFLPWGRRRDEILAQLRYYLDPSVDD